MKKFLWIILVLAASPVTFAQSSAATKFVFESNLPDELFTFVTQAKFQTTYEIRTDLNPFYLRGDFDGDNKQDYALSIVDKKSQKKGILVYHAGTKLQYVIGAGKSLVNRPDDDYKWMDAWKVHTQRNVESGVGETEKLTLKSEAILVLKLEASSGLIYWTGKEYRWYQQGD